MIQTRAVKCFFKPELCLAFLSLEFDWLTGQVKRPAIWILLSVLIQMPLIARSHAQSNQPSSDSKESSVQSPDEAFLFFPSKFPAGDWQPQGLTFQDVFFTSQDGSKLHGWFCPAETPRAIVLIAHGNAGNVASRASWLRYLQTKANCSVFMFDYRGYGRSEGVPTVKGAIEDAAAARAQLAQLAAVTNKEIVLMGESLGGAIAIQLAAASPPRALILQSTFTSLRGMADVHYPKLAWLVSAQKLNSLSLIAKYQGPLLQSHGTQDRTIPFTMAETLFRAANEPKQFLAIRGADHNDWLTDDYLRQLDAFIDRLNAPPK